MPKHEREDVPMDEYEVDIAGVPHTVQLNADDAARLGARPKPAPANKQAQPPLNKQATGPTPTQAPAQAPSSRDDGGTRSAG